MILNESMRAILVDLQWLGFEGYYEREEREKGQIRACTGEQAQRREMRDCVISSGIQVPVVLL